MWQVYKRGPIYRVGQETGRFKPIHWHLLCREEPKIYWETCDKEEAFAKAKELNNPPPKLHWELVEE